MAQYPYYAMDDFVLFSLEGCKMNQSLTQRRRQSMSFSCQSKEEKSLRPPKKTAKKERFRVVVFR